MSIPFIPCIQDLSASFSYLGNCLSINGVLGATPEFKTDLQEVLKVAMDEMYKLNLITGSDKKSLGNAFDFNACIPKLLAHLWNTHHFSKLSRASYEAILNLYIYRFWLKERMLRREFKNKQTKDVFIDLLKRITHSIILSKRWMVLYYPKRLLDFTQTHSVIKLELKDRHAYKLDFSDLNVYTWLYNEHMRLPDYVALYLDNRDTHIGCSLLYHPFVLEGDGNLPALVKTNFPFSYINYAPFRAGVSIHLGV